MALPPCHTLFQFFVQEGGSAASFISGVPTCSCCSASLRPADLMVAQVLPRGKDLVHTFGDLHLYALHLSRQELQFGNPGRCHN